MVTLSGGPGNGAYRLVGDVTAYTFGAIPRSTVGGPDVQVARRVHTRCLSRYQAIGLLLAFDQPDDGYALLRGLMLDSQRLQVMARRPAQRVALALGWQDAAIRDLEQRAREARSVGETKFAAAITSVTVPQRTEMDAVQRELGVRKRLRFPQEGKALAVAAGHPSDTLDWVIASDPAHGSLPTSLWHDRRVPSEPGDGQVMREMIGGNNPGWRNTVADRATRHFVRATWAMAEVCRLPNATDLKDYAAETERRLDAEELPEPD